MKKSITLLFLAAAFVLHGQFNPQTKKVTEKFFPEMDITINTPAFQKKKGFTKYDELMAFINQKVEAHPEMISYVFIGESQKGKQIPMLTLTNSTSTKHKLNVWIQGGLHGNEPASTEGVLHLIDRLLEDKANYSLLDDLVINIVPMANIDGYEKQDRYAANGLDLNRDQTKFTAPESISLKKAFSDFNPDVALDFHEYRPYRRDFAKMSDWGVTSSFDVMFLYSGNLNVPKEVRRLTEMRFVEPAKKVMAENNLSYTDYMTSTDVVGEIQFNQGSVNPRSSATNYALTNCVSTLIEVRGVGLGRTSFKRRVFTTYAIGLSYLQSAQANAEEVRKVFEFVQQSPAETVVVKSKRKSDGQQVPFIDIATNELMPLGVVVRDAWKSKATLTRPRPAAYIILPGNDKAIANLITLGITVRQIEVATEIEVETYKVVAIKREPYPYEGVHVQEVDTEVSLATKSIPAGAYIIDLNQERGNLLGEVLEPEASSSFVSFEIIKTALGAELPIYRYMKKERL